MHTEIRQIKSRRQSRKQEGDREISENERMFLVSKFYQADCCDLYKLNPLFLLLCFSVNTASLVKIIYSIQMRASDKEPVFPRTLCISLSAFLSGYHHPPPAFSTSAFDGQLVPPQTCSPVGQPKAAFVFFQLRD